MKFHIIGAGMAGLLAGAVLRTDAVAVWEAQSELPNNHTALLRFRTDKVAQAINVPFKEVSVMKAVVPAVGNPVGDAIAYSMRTNGTASLRSVVSAEGKVEKRFIAPSNLIEAMACRVSAEIKLGEPMSAFELNKLVGVNRAVISTMPMPLLMDLLDYDKPEFEFVHGFTVNCNVPNCDVYATLYFPGLTSFYRASLTGSRLTLEYCNPTYPNGVKMMCNQYINERHLPVGDITTALEHFGIKLDIEAIMSAQWNISVNPQKYAKIKPIDEKVRKHFIMWASDKHRIFSLGRFATWRPGLLLDDVVNDIRVIQHVASHGNYDHRKVMSNG
jgi:hypothetical protein